MIGLNILFLALCYVRLIRICHAYSQVTGKLPTASIEKTDGCQLYLSKESMNCQIISAKSSEMNISVPQDDGDFVRIMSLMLVSFWLTIIFVSGRVCYRRAVSICVERQNVCDGADGTCGIISAALSGKQIPGFSCD